MNLDIEYLKMAYRVAYNESTDPSTQNGVILVDPKALSMPWEANGVVAQGANHFPKGVKESEERWQRPLKYSFVEHGERNCIYNAAKNGVKTEGLIMYGCWVACTDCARAIIQAGIREVVTHYNPDPPNGERFGMPVHPQWKDSITIALGMLKEAEVNVRWIEDQLFHPDELQIKFNGTLITP